MLLFYSNENELILQKHDIIVRISEHIDNKEELFKIFSTQLHFPPYFGRNWDAFYDCLCNLDYLNKKAILILHEDLPFKESETERTAYLDTLSDIELIIAKDDAYKIDLAFPQKYKDIIGA